MRDSAFYLRPLLNDGSMKNNWQHKMFGVHYLRPTSDPFDATDTMRSISMFCHCALGLVTE